MVDENNEKPPKPKTPATSLFSSMFFGPGETAGTSRTVEIRPPLEKESDKETAAPAENADRITRAANDLASRIDEIIPKDKEALRETSIFQAAYKAVAFQRDQYLVGEEYAEWKRTKQEDRKIRKGFFDRRRRFRENELPYDPAALGHKQIADLAAWFVPSMTVVQAATPLIQPLPVQVLFDPSKHALLQIIASQQDTVDRIMRQGIIDVLYNPDIRTSIKRSTQGFLSKW